MKLLCALVFVTVFATPACSRANRKEVQNSASDVQPSADQKPAVSTKFDTLQESKECAAQAEKVIREDPRWRFALWESHYSPKYRKCFIKGYRNHDYTILVLPRASHASFVEPGEVQAFKWSRLAPGFPELLTAWISQRMK